MVGFTVRDVLPRIVPLARKTPKTMELKAQLVERPLGEGRAHVLRLGALDEVAEDPATTTAALPVAADPAGTAPGGRCSS
jgi:hypothetical protein